MTKEDVALSFMGLCNPLTAITCDTTEECLDFCKFLDGYEITDCNGDKYYADDLIEWFNKVPKEFFPMYFLGDGTIYSIHAIDDTDRYSTYKYAEVFNGYKVELI